MTALKKALLAGLAYAAVIGVCALIGGGPAHTQIAPGTPVTVTNKITQPVPSLIVNSGSQPVPVSLPVNTAVNLATNAQVGINPAANTVMVGNPLADPVLIRSVNDAVEPVSIVDSTSVTSAGVDFLVYTVPANRRLVLEDVAARISGLAAGQEVISALVRYSRGEAGDATRELPMGLQRGGFSTGGDAVRLYVEGGEIVRFGLRRTGSGNEILISIAMVGYLTNPL